jgi:hypothetical protein
MVQDLLQGGTYTVIHVVIMGRSIGSNTLAISWCAVVLASGKKGNVFSA